jgi:PAS domain S-box-containing protein
MGGSHEADRPEVSLDDVLSGDGLGRRPSRSPDLRAENRALAALAETLAESPRSILEKLADTALEMCRAGSAGVSLLDADAGASRFRWVAVAGEWARHAGGSLPRDASPCGVVLDRDTPLLFTQPGRFFPDVAILRPTLVETLMVPFRVRGEPVGTVWANAHTPDRQFDAEDARLLARLAGFASGAYQIVAALELAEAGRAELERRVEERTRELSEANEALRESESLYRSIAANLPNGAIFVVDRGLRFRLADGQALRDAGLSPADLEGKALREALGAELAGLHEPDYRTALSGRPFRTEHERNDRHYATHGVPLRGAGVEVDAVLAVSYDITESRRAESALRESEERFRLLVENVRDYGICFLDNEGRVVGWSEGAERLLGYREEEVLGRPPDRFFIAEDLARDLPRRELEEAVATGRAEDENWLVRSDGTRFWASGSTNALRDSDGRLRGFVKIFRDLTERRAAEAAVREGRERLRLALSAARMGIWTWDPESNIQTRDENLNRLLGLEPVETSQPLGEFFDHIHPDDWADVTEALAASVRQDRPLNLEFRVIRPDGSVRWLRDQGDVFNAAGAGRPLMAGACVDVTDLKEAESALRRARDELEDRVVERTAELARANETLTELLRRVVTAQEEERRRVSRELHDGLGQELTALILGLKALEATIPEGAPGRERLREVEATVGRIGREAHDLAIDLRPTALDDIGLAPALAAYIARWAERTGVVADFQAPGMDADRLPPEVETTLYRVVQEALNNVAKHGGARRVSVIVERRRGEVTALVEDDGRGFEPGRVVSGPGPRRLGLLGMRERVALVGGTLLIESGEGEGTTLRARIPLRGPSGETAHGD